MPNFIVKLTDKKAKIDYFVDWSTIIDAPTSEPMTLEQAKAELKKRFKGSVVEGVKAINSLIKNGVSSPYENLKDVLWCSDHSKKELLEIYCKPFEKKFKKKVAA